MNEFQINGAQSNALRDVLQDYNDGDPVLFTMQGNGTLVVAFNLVTVEIDTTGTVEGI